LSSINNKGQNERTDSEKETDRLVQEFLSNGGTITKCAPNARTEEVAYTNNWGGRKPKPKATVETESDTNEE
jgi:hypothetical protein